MQQDNRIGLLFALAGFVSLSLGDAVIKTMAGEWSPIAVAALRFTFGTIGLASILLIRERKSGFFPKRPLLQFARGLCIAMATLGFFTALFFMPLAETTALTFVAPILTAILSGPVLKESVRPITWGAGLAAFAGVLLILRPNFAVLGPVALLPLGSAFFMSFLVLANRASARDGSALSMQFFLAGVAAPILIVAAAVGQISGVQALHVGMPDWTIVARCAVVAITASTAHWFIYLGTTRAGAATIAPMTYIQLLVAVILGWIIFGDRPDLLTILGAAIIIGAGLMLWWSGQADKAPAREMPTRD